LDNAKADAGVATNDEQQKKSTLAQSSNQITNAESAGATPRTHPFLAISAQHYTASQDPLFFPSLSRGDEPRPPRARHQRALQGGAAVLSSRMNCKKKGCRDAVEKYRCVVVTRGPILGAFA
jgi:hypothetical protein